MAPSSATTQRRATLSWYDVRSVMAAAAGPPLSVSLAGGDDPESEAHRHTFCQDVSLSLFKWVMDILINNSSVYLFQHSGTNSFPLSVPASSAVELWLQWAARRSHHQKNGSSQAPAQGQLAVDLLLLEQGEMGWNVVIPFFIISSCLSACWL